MIVICLLGSGATMPTPTRGLSAAVLRCNGRCLLLDCGEGTQAALRREKFSLVKTDLIALSHYHGDHIFGLPGLLQSMSCLERREPLYITGPEGLEEAMAPILALAGVQNFEIRLITFPSEGLLLHDINPAWPRSARCEAIPVQHRVNAQAYKFSLARAGKFDVEKAKALSVPVEQWKELIAEPQSSVMVEGREVFGFELMGEARRGLSVVFSGDTLPCDALRLAAEDADLLIHDATYGSDEDAEQALIYGHSSFRQAAELAAAAKVRRLWLTHFSQAMKDPADFIGNAAALPEAVCGYDGLRLTLRFD